MQAPCRVWGTAGGRSVLALHCSLAHSGAWANLAGLLDGVTVTAIDLPGHGKAPDWDGKTDIHALATDLAIAWAQRLGQGAAIDVMGHSFGGTVALRLALTRPDLVRSLTLIEPVYFVAAREEGSSTYAAFEATHSLIAERLAEGSARLAADDFMASWGSGEQLSELPERMQSYILDRIRLVVAQNPVLLEDAPGLLTPGRLESLKCPVLLVEGANSPPIISAINDVFERRLTHVSRFRQADAGHMVAITHARELAPVVQAHLDVS